MSELDRLKRITKSLVPNFTRNRKRYYNFEDAKMMITDLALGIPPDYFAILTEREALLDDFLNNVYQLEDAMGKQDVVTEFSTLNPEYQPKVYIKNGKVIFTVTYGTLLKQEVVFAEYQLGAPTEPRVIDIPIE